MIGRPKKNRMTVKDESKKLKSGHFSRKFLIMTCTQRDQHGHNKQSYTQGSEHAKQQAAQPPKQKGKSPIKKLITSDKS
ncbi:hypothetical protein Goklo_019998 [Gossypium klotzschianum]|uniref:Uncharacterized protein n=1 Tax=Gossypium klotzschianum TaxID=34286 RepID=A0A7J8UQV9_9ROSI|nr:hypothetical protein [Gossypium klotzschianum]